MEQSNDILEQIIKSGEQADLEKKKEQYYSNIVSSCANLNILYETLKEVENSVAGEGDPAFFKVAIHQVAGIIDQLSGGHAPTKNLFLPQTPVGIKGVVESGVLEISMKYGLRSKVEELLSTLAVRDGVVDVEV
jgi:hypothetical protein